LKEATGVWRIPYQSPIFVPLREDGMCADRKFQSGLHRLGLALAPLPLILGIGASNLPS
jgi:hypothetical protein